MYFFTLLLEFSGYEMNLVMSFAYHLKGQKYEYSKNVNLALDSISNDQIKFFVDS